MDVNQAYQAFEAWRSSSRWVFAAPQESCYGSKERTCKGIGGSWLLSCLDCGHFGIFEVKLLRWKEVQSRSVEWSAVQWSEVESSSGERSRTKDMSCLRTEFALQFRRVMIVPLSCSCLSFSVSTCLRIMSRLVSWCLESSCLMSLCSHTDVFRSGFRVAFVRRACLPVASLAVFRVPLSYRPHQMLTFRSPGRCTRLGLYCKFAFGFMAPSCGLLV